MTTLINAPIARVRHGAAACFLPDRAVRGAWHGRSGSTALRCRWLPTPDGGLAMCWAEEEEGHLRVAPAPRSREPRLLARSVRRPARRRGLPPSSGRAPHRRAASVATPSLA